MQNTEPDSNESTDSTLDDFTEDGIIVAGDDGEILDDETCACDGLPDGVPCWPCYRDGAEFDD